MFFRSRSPIWLIFPPPLVQNFWNRYYNIPRPWRRPKCIMWLGGRTITLRRIWIRCLFSLSERWLNAAFACSVIPYCSGFWMMVSELQRFRVLFFIGGNILLNFVLSCMIVCHLQKACSEGRLSTHWWASSTRCQSAPGKRPFGISGV